MERPRSFRRLAPRTTGSVKPPTPTIATTYAAPTAVPSPTEPTAAPASATPTTAPASARPTTPLASAKPTTVPASARSTTVPPSAPRDTSYAKKTTTTAKGSLLPSVTRTELVAALPAPPPSEYDAKRVAKGKGHEGDDRKRSFDRDDVIDVDRESKRARARSVSPPRRVSRSGFQDKTSTSSLFSTLVFYNDVVTPINTDPSGDMMRQGLKFLALVNKVGHKLETEVEDLKKKIEVETRRTENAHTVADGLQVERDAVWASIDNKNKELTDKAKEIVSLKAEARRSAAALLAEAEKSALALVAAEEREQYSVTKVVDRLRQADEQIRSLERKFAHAKGNMVYQGDPRSNMVYQVQRVANVDFVRLLLGLLDGHEPLKLEDELTFLTVDVAEHVGDEERFEQLMKSLHRLLHVLDSKVPAVVTHDRTLGTYVATVNVADPSGSLLGGTDSHKDAVVSVDGKFSLIGGVGAEVTKSRIKDVAEGVETVGTPEEMRTDEDSQDRGSTCLPRIQDSTTSLERQRLSGRRSPRLLLQELAWRPFLSCVLRVC
ncbi:hypothetical protein AALP_AA4G092900 [Arabis alpina]|uniref:Uncharacterized protein n=1 Tax=Arabis alpina TaxID=50452 RepID=A0A087H264_ARAAL|nr:hypothetical protein AALP_AA4G092900 [Arabis alpina]